MMGDRRAHLAAALGWVGSLGLHLTAALSVLGVVPVGDVLASALRAEERRVDTEDADRASVPVPPPPPAPEDAAQPQPVALEPPPLPEPEPEPEDLAQEVTLGVDESTATDTRTWLGFATPTDEHGGPVRGYEQAQLTRAPGERAARLDLTPGLGADARTPSASAPMGDNNSDARTHGERATADGVRTETGDALAFVAATATPQITLAREDVPPLTPDRRVSPGVRAPGVGAIAQDAARAIERAQAAASRARAERAGAAGGAPPAGAGTPVDETARPPAEAERLDPGGAEGDEDAFGFLSDRDSDAAAIKAAISVNPGKPLAAKGLRIQTVRPRWSTYALATANPNDVVVRIWFDSSGRVTKATIIQSSGRDDVDRPILDSVYNWRAAGEHLQTIRNQPDGRLQLVFKIDLER